MAFSQEMIEKLHREGKMPDWAYYQQNGKSAQENWEEQHRKIMEWLHEQEAQKQLEKDIEKQVYDAVEKALDELLKDFK